MKITLDTNALPADTLIEECAHPEWEFSVITVTERELGGTDLQVGLKALGSVPESLVWDESAWGKGAWGSKDSDAILNRILKVISHGSFPARRDALSAGERNQLRDAMILEAHVRERRDVFVTGDVRAFIRDGRREELEREFGTRIMTLDEFAAFCAENK